MSDIKSRFAPSPTGYLHIGSLRTVLYEFLFAKKEKGQFLLRIEDTDQTREVEGADKQLIEILEKFKIIPDNQDQIMYQSKRLAVYQKFAQQLVSENKAYYCFCAPQRLNKMREEQTKAKKPPMYDRQCLKLSTDEINKKLAAKEEHVIRLQIPKAGKTLVNDLVYGKVEFENQTIDDQIILKSDGFPTYHLAHIIDDQEMGITHVIRADEWLPSTPKHILIHQALGWKPPQYAHLPLLTNPDKSKLSKRQGDVAVEDYLQKGYLVAALVNFVALLGWNPGKGSTDELFNLPELLTDYQFKQNEVKNLYQAFNLKEVNKSSAVFDISKLEWLNGWYIRHLKPEKYWQLAQPYLNKIKDQSLAQKIAIVEQERLKKLSDLSQNIEFFYQNIKYPADLLIWKKSNREDTLSNLVKLEDFLTNSIAKKEFLEIKLLENKTIEWIKANDYGVGDILWPMRVALSGEKNSPGPFEIAWVLGKAETLKRINQAQEYLK